MTETPWAVKCYRHGQVFLTQEQYDYQLDRPNKGWMCPKCGEPAEWDDDNYEKHMFGDEPLEDEPAF